MQILKDFSSWKLENKSIPFGQITIDFFNLFPSDQVTSLLLASLLTETHTSEFLTKTANHLIRSCQESLYSHGLKSAVMVSQKAVVSKGSVLLQDCFEADQLFCLLPFDVAQLVTNPKITQVKQCRNCGKLFFSENPKLKYCPDCRKNMKKIRYLNRKKNAERMKHTQICNYIGLWLDCGTENFRKRSNNYWLRVRNGSRTTAQYRKWLDRQLVFYKNLRKAENQRYNS